MNGTMPTWITYLAVFGNIVAILGGLAGLGLWVRKWVDRIVEAKVSHPLATNAGIANQANVTAKEARKIAINQRERVDHLYSVIGGA